MRTSKCFSSALVVALVAALAIAPSAGAALKKTIKRSVSTSLTFNAGTVFPSLRIPKNTNKNGVKYKVGKIKNVKVGVRINHNRDRQLTMSLLHPGGATIELSSANGGNGDNYGFGSNSCRGTLTTFSDGAAVSITSGAPPFAGTFRPEDPLANLRNRRGRGRYFLAVTDADPGGGAVATLGCYRLRVKVRLKPL